MDTSTFLHFTEASRAEFIRYTNLCRMDCGLAAMTPEEEERDYAEWKQSVVATCERC